MSKRLMEERDTRSGYVQPLYCRTALESTQRPRKSIAYKNDRNRKGEPPKATVVRLRSDPSSGHPHVGGLIEETPRSIKPSSRNLVRRTAASSRPSWSSRVGNGRLPNCTALPLRSVLSTKSRFIPGYGGAVQPAQITSDVYKRSFILILWIWKFALQLSFRRCKWPLARRNALPVDHRAA